MSPPSPRVAANRRRLFLWSPLTLVGGLLFALGILADDIYMSAIGLVLTAPILPGLLMDTGREVTTTKETHA